MEQPVKQIIKDAFKHWANAYLTKDDDVAPLEFKDVLSQANSLDEVSEYYASNLEKHHNLFLIEGNSQ